MRMPEVENDGERPTTEATEIVENLFRREWGKIVATLTRVFGIERLELVEDVVQEAFLRWQPASEHEIGSTKAYLTTITTHLCLDHLKRAYVKREEYPGPWLPEPVMIHTPEMLAGDEDSLSFAFLILLERLSPVERAARPDAFAPAPACFVPELPASVAPVLHERHHRRLRHQPVRAAPPRRAVHVASRHRSLLKNRKGHISEFVSARLLVECLP